MKEKQERKWSSADWFMTGIRVFGFAIGMTNVFNNDMDGRIGYVVSLAILSLAVPQLFYLPGYIRARWFIAAEIAFTGGYTLYLVTIDPDAKGYFLLPLFVICYLCTKRDVYWVAPISLIALPLAIRSVGQLSWDGLLINLVLNFGIFAAFGFGFGVFLRQRDRLSDALGVIEEKNRALEHALGQVERVTLLEERNRMSRELHDTVGHSLTASIVAMEAVQTLITRDPKAAEERLGQLISYSRSHLDAFRGTVHDMAMDELRQPLTALLRQAADAFAAQTGTVVTLETAGDGGQALPDAVKLALLRCLQEALTNAKRHGGATEIVVALRQDEQRLSLRVADNGSGLGEAKEGFGLAGMRERIESLRGVFKLVSNPGGGTTVICEIPKGV